MSEITSRQFPFSAFEIYAFGLTFYTVSSLGSLDTFL